MKYLIFFTLLFGFTGDTFAQKADDKTQEVYTLCLKKHLEYNSRLAISIGSASLANRILYSKRTSFFDIDSLVIDSFRVIFLRHDDLKLLTSRGKSVPMMVVTPVEFGKNGPEIGVIDFLVSRKKNHYRYENSGGSSFLIKFDNTREEYVVTTLFQR